MLKVAVVGLGFIGSEQVEAIRRTALAEVKTVVDRTAEGARKKAGRLNVPQYTTELAEVLNDPEIDVVHICTPNSLHYPMTKMALEAGKHVVCEKPLTLLSKEAEELYLLAEEKNLVNAIHFNIRYYPLIRHAREMVARGDIGKIYSITGSYLQDWLFKDTDYSWRLEKEHCGETRAVGDIGTHWMDLVEYVSGTKMVSVNADMATFLPFRKKPSRSIETWSGKMLTSEDYTEVPISTEDYATVMFRAEDGIRGAFTVNQMAAGRKNSLSFAIDGAKGSLLWNSEEPNKLTIGRRDEGNVVVIRDPSLLYPSAADIISLPGGHNEGFADTSKQLFGEVYRYILAGDYTAVPTFPIFRDGYREALLCEAIVKSACTEKWEFVNDDLRRDN